MWPFERQADVVRVGRNRVEYWASSAQGLVLRGEQAIAGAESMQAAALAVSLGLLFQTVRGAAGSHQSAIRIDMIFESAWMPIMLIEAGHSLWSPKPIEALLRHRFAQLYNDRDDPTAIWRLQLDHQPGDAYGLGYGMAPSIRQAAIDAAAAAGVRLASLQPAFSWGRQRLRRQRGRVLGGAARRNVWWLWIEQDRSLVCHFDDRGRLNSLNTGAAVPKDAAQCLRFIDIEALRQGVPAAETPGVVAGWHQAPHAARGSIADRLAFVTVAAEEAALPFGSAPPVHAGAGA